eukprot:4314081-Pyramimonas_sp.AAC.1
MGKGYTWSPTTSRVNEVQHYYCIPRIQQARGGNIEIRYCKACFESSRTCRFVDGKYALPSKCASDGCRGKSFTPERSTARLVDHQRLRLEESNSADDREEGRVPRTIDCDLTEGLGGDGL